LAYKTELVEELDLLITTQEEAVSSGSSSSVTENFFASIYKLDIERMKYLLKSYLRTRLLKIQKLYLDIIRNDKGDLLSESEYEFVAKFFIHKKTHFQTSFSRRLPNELEDFVDPSGENTSNPNCPVNPEMVVEPNMARPVFVKIAKAVGKLGQQDSGVSSNLKLGNVVFMPYERCKGLLDTGVAELV